MKRIFFASAALLVTVFASAQNSNVHFGLKAGLNVASVNVENGTDLDSKASFHVGGLAHIHVSPHFAVQPELVFSGQGGEANNNVKLNLGYVNVPVMFQYMTGTGFRLEAGPQLGFMLSAKTKSGNTTVDVKDNYKTVDFGLGLGAGYKFMDSGFGIDARYNFGISSFNEGTTDLQNRVFQVGVFYQFMH